MAPHFESYSPLRPRLKRLTVQETNTVRYIAWYILRHGHPPTLKTIAAWLGVKSVTAVWEFVEEIVHKGYLLKEPAVARGLSFTDLGEQWAMAQKIDPNSAITVTRTLDSGA